MKTSTAVAVGVGILVVAGVGAALLKAGTGKPRVTVKLRMQASVCVPDDPERLGGKKGHKLTWDVENVDCPTPQFFAFKNFKKGGKSGTVVPGVLDPDPVVSTEAAQVGKPAVSVTAKVDKTYFFSGEIYYYEIWLGPSAGSLTMRLDPDIDIWPIF